MRKTVVLPIAAIILSGCTNSTSTTELGEIEGYWLQVESDWSGDVTDLSENKDVYLEITPEKMYFYRYFDDTDTHAVAKKFYKIEDEKIYYNYYEFKGSRWKDNIDDMCGGVFYPRRNHEKLILTRYYNDENEDEGYEKYTYVKVDAKDWPIEE